MQIPKWNVARDAKMDAEKKSREVEREVTECLRESGDVP